MSVSGELLCSFELLKPLDSSALKRHIKKGRNERQNMLNSPVSQLVNRGVQRPKLIWSSPRASTLRVISLVEGNNEPMCTHDEVQMQTMLWHSVGSVIGTCCNELGGQACLQGADPSQSMRSTSSYWADSKNRCRVCV